MNNKNLTTSDEILGKETITSEGEILGIVQKLHIDKTTKQIVGVTIDEGFMKPFLFVGIEYIKLFGIDAIFLNTAPYTKFRGLKVFDKNGEQKGTVQDVILTPRSNKPKELVVKHNFKTTNIPLKAIKSIGINVILK